MRLSRIYSQEFKRSSPGYDEDSVHRFLDQVMMEMEQLAMLIQQMESGEVAADIHSIPEAAGETLLSSLPQSPTGYDRQEVKDYLEQMNAERHRLREHWRQLRQKHGG